MIVSIGQPAYLPWPGYYDRILKSDLHISLDHVQFEKRGLTKRNKIKTAQGWTWLAVPVKTKGKYKDCPINKLEIDNESDWRKKHLSSLLNCYKKAVFFNEYLPFFEEVYSLDWNLLSDLLDKINQFLLRVLEIKTEIIKSSDMRPKSTKSDLILELCRKAEASKYISGPFGRDYLDRESFDKAGIEILFHDYHPKSYPQLFGDFEPYMSVIDMLFNCGAKESHQILQTPLGSLKRT